MTGESTDKDQVSRMKEETAQIMCSQMDAIQRQGSQRVLSLTWVSKGNTGDGAQVDAFAIGCSMQLAGKHQDEYMSLGPPWLYIRCPQHLSILLSFHLPTFSLIQITLGTYAWKLIGRKVGKVKLLAYKALEITALENGEYQSRWVTASAFILLTLGLHTFSYSQTKELWKR